MSKRIHRNKVDYTSRHYYRHFVSTCTDIDLPETTHTKILKTFAIVVMEKIVNDMYKFRIPGLGSIYMMKKKILVYEKDGKVISNAPLDFKETKKLRELTNDPTRKVVMLNEHTNGYVYKIRWNKRLVKFVNKTFYTFKISRMFSQYMKSCILGSIKPLNAYAK